jgi:hypothetical protein
MSEYEALAVGFGVMPKHLLAYDWNSGPPEDPQHMSWVVLWHPQHSMFANHIWRWNTLWDIEYFGWLWDTARLFVPQPQFWWDFIWRSGAPEWFGYISIWQIHHRIFSYLRCSDVSVSGIDYFCQNMRSWLTYS